MEWGRFGHLVRELRLALRWRYGRRVRQEDLDALCGFLRTGRKGMVGRIERGEKRCLEEDVLVALADAFHLTRMERREFFLAANGVAFHHVYTGRHHMTPEQELELLCRRLSYLHLPACILDPFADIVATNLLMVRLHDISSEILQEAIRGKIFPNLLYLTFSSRLAIYEMIRGNPNWEEILISVVQFFRRISLQFRTTRYWHFLVERLWNAPDHQVARFFRRYWTEAEHWPDLDGNLSRHYHLTHPRWGPLNLITLVAEEITGAGPLYIVVYAPTDLNTMKILYSLAQEESRPDSSIPVMRLALWPLEKKEEIWIPPEWQPPVDTMWGG